MTLPIEADLPARLLRRYKRFFADVETEDGRVLTVHCPNPGRMLGCDAPGSAVRCSESRDPRRSLRHTLEMVRSGRTWVGLHTLRANQLAARALEAGVIRELSGYRRVRREVRVGASRLDFRLEQHVRRRPRAFVEVKSVTLARGGRVACFPDSVTERGRRHVEALAKLCAGGARAVLLYVVQRGDCDSVAPADDLDPAYADALRRAAQSGVEVFAVRARVGARSLRLECGLPVVL